MKRLFSCPCDTTGSECTCHASGRIDGHIEERKAILARLREQARLRSSPLSVGLIAAAEEIEGLAHWKEGA